MTALQPEELFACLERHDVRYVLIGGLAGVLHGSPLPTIDADVYPSRDRDNLHRLASALKEIDARIRTPDTDRPKDHRTLPVLHQLLDEIRKRRPDPSR